MRGKFLSYWQKNPHTRLIRMSLYTPQIGELSMERLSRADRARVVADLRQEDAEARFGLGPELGEQGNAAFLNRAVGFGPSISLQEGVRRFVEWYRDYHGR